MRYQPCLPTRKATCSSCLLLASCLLCAIRAIQLVEGSRSCGLWDTGQSLCPVRSAVQLGSPGRSCAGSKNGCHVLLIRGIKLTGTRLQSHCNVRLVSVLLGWKECLYPQLRSKLSNTTFAALDVSSAFVVVGLSRADLSTQCSSCQIAARKIRSSMLRSHESASRRSTCSRRTLREER